MKINKIIFIPLLVSAIFFIPASPAHSVDLLFNNAIDTDSTSSLSLIYFFDLRDRETFIQLTYFEKAVQGISANMHIQIFDVSNNCNENDFFDVYTPNDTHVYNMRDIQTNDGNPSGVVLPDGAYGIVTVVYFPVILVQTNIGMYGNLRILDESGYEYRTNAPRLAGAFTSSISNPGFTHTFNFNMKNGIVFSDIVGVTVDFNKQQFEYQANPQSVFNLFDVDIIDNNEVPFSCRDIIFACVNQESIDLESLLEFAGSASVASFEYGINNSLPLSKGGELLCPGNNIDEGFVILRPEPRPNVEGITPETFIFIGLNNGNGRGSLDSIWNDMKLLN